MRLAGLWADYLAALALMLAGHWAVMSVDCLAQMLADYLGMMWADR